MKRARLPVAFAVAILAALAPERAARAAGPDPAAEAARLLAKLDAPETRAIVEQPVTKSKAAQARANSARAAGDLRHATELDALALTWAQVADDLVRTAAAEKQLAELQKSVADLEQKAVRTQALIEQTIARRARAEQNLKSLPKPSAPTPNALTTAPKAAAGASHPGPKPSAPAGKK